MWVFIRNELNESRSTKNECLIININYSDNSETHWTCLFIPDDVSFYFDPFMIQPTLEVEEYCSRVYKRCYTSFPIQNIKL